MTVAVVSYPILCVAVPRADNASSFLYHPEDVATVDVAHNVGIIWSHNPAIINECVTMIQFNCIYTAPNPNNRRLKALYMTHDCRSDDTFKCVIIFFITYHQLYYKLPE